MEYDWESRAAGPVGDGGSSSSSSIQQSNYTPSHHLHPFAFTLDDLLLPDSPENFRGTTAAFDQLEGLYKPFPPLFSDSVPQEYWEMKPDHQKLMINTPLQSLSQQRPPAVHATKIKKIRKNQQKRVVQHVKEDGLQSDTWAWRKYGQKPIKGSPYPRSYYRCSSSKGCVARKQVERCSSDPTTFIITYTAEHNHSGPARRSSLARTKRNKDTAAFAVLPVETAPNDAAAMEVEEKIREDVGAVEERQDQSEEAIMSKELVSSLEDLEALLMDQTFLDHVSPEYNWPIQDFAATLIGENS